MNKTEITEIKEKKGVLHDYMVIPCQAIARAVGVIGIQAIVAPVGCLYHSAKAIIHRVKGLNDFASHKKAAEKDFFVVMTLVAFVSIPIIQGYIGERSQSLVFSIMQLGFLTSGIFPAVGTSLFCSRSEREKIVAELYYRIELGVRPTVNSIPSFYPSENLGFYHLRDLSIGLELEILNKIAFIQSKLPPEHLLPYNSKLNDSKKLLDSIEQIRETIKPAVWKEIVEYRNGIVRHFSDLKTLQSYLDSSATLTAEDLVQEAYKGGKYTKNSLPLVDRVSVDTAVTSLTVTLFKKMLESDFFFPSNCLPQNIEDKGSITSSLAETNLFIKRQPITSISHKLAKPLRVIARYGAIIAIGSLGGAVGVVYHTGKILLLGAQVLRGGDSSYGNMEKLKAHAWALFADLNSAVITGSYIGMSTLFVYVNSYVLTDYIIGSCISLCINYIPLVSSFDPTYWIPFVSYRDERQALFKTITLKNEFGMVSKTGKLLTYNRMADIQSNPDADSWLWNSWVKGWGNLLVETGHLQSLLKIKNLPLDRKNFSEFNKSLLSAVEKHLKENLEENEMIGELSRDKWIAYYRNLIEGVEVLRSSMETCYSRCETVAMPVFHLNNKEKSLKVQTCPFPQSLVTQALNGEIENLFDSLWSSSIITAKKQWSALYKQTPTTGPSDEFIELRKIIVESHELKIWEVFGYKECPQSIDEVKKKYRTLSLKCHPDKVDVQWRAEADILFSVLADAYQQLISEINKSEEDPEILEEEVEVEVNQETLSLTG